MKRHALGSGLLMICLGCPLSGCGTCDSRRDVADAQAVSVSTTIQTRSQFVMFDGTGRQTFDVVIEKPMVTTGHTVGVLLIGGGLGNDLDWTVPGFIDAGEMRVQLTLDGAEHADGAAISRTLAERGLVVMRWSTLAIEDPLADQWPVRATPRTLGEMLEQTRAALSALRRSSAVDPDRIVLVGHSLGAARACTIAADDPGVMAIVLLAPAYFTRSQSPARSFEEQGMRFGEDVLRERPIPCLAVFGELDASRSVDAPAAMRLAEELHNLDARLMPGLGHQLGRYQDGRHGPIEPDVLQAIGDWIERIIADR